MKHLTITLALLATSSSLALAQTPINPQDTVNNVAIGTIGGDAVAALQTGTMTQQSILSPLTAAAADGNAHLSLFPTASTIVNGVGPIQNYISPNSLILGGLGLQNDGHLIVRGTTDGPFDMGTLVSIGMTNNNVAGSRAGLGPSNGGISSYPGGLDGAALGIVAGDVAPEISVGQDFTSSDGVTHSVTYTTTTAVITPALSASMTAFIAARPSLDMMTNSTDGYVLPAGYTTTLPIHTYAGQVSSIATNATSSTITVGGWSIPGSNTSGTPGTTYDTIRTNYPHAALFIGAITKAFPANYVCQLGGNDAGGTNDFGTVNTQVRECGTEDDHFDYDTVDYKQHFDGLVEVYKGLGKVPNTNPATSHQVLPASDSHAFYCGGQWAACFQAADGDHTDAFISNALNGYNIFGLSDQGTEAVGTSAPMGQFAGYTTSSQQMNLVASMTKVATTTGWLGTEADWCYYEGAARQAGPSPNRQSCLAFNVAGNPGSVGLLGYGGTGLTVNTSGTVSTSGDILGGGAVKATGLATLLGGASITGTEQFLSGSTGGAKLATDSSGNLIVGSAASGAALLSSIPVIGNGGLISGSNGARALSTGQVQLTWNATSYGGEGDIVVPSGTGTATGFSVYIETANTVASLFKLFGSDNSGNISATGNITPGNDKALALTTAASGARSLSLYNASSTAKLIDSTGAAAGLNVGAVAATGLSVSGAATFQMPVSFPNYAYGSLPATGHVGNQVECSNCLKPGESANSGTGMMVFDDGHSHWVTMAGTVAMP